MKAALRVFPALVVLGMSLSGQAQAQSSGESFLLISPSARSYALGASDVVSSLGAESIGANPANLGLLDRRYEVFSSYAGLMGGLQYGHFAAAFSLPPSSPIPLEALGLSVTRLGVSGLQGADSLGNMTGSSFGASDTAVAISAAGKLSSRLRLGVTAKAIESSIAGYNSGASLAGDVGLTYASPLFTAGVSVDNLGPGVRFIDQVDPLPTTLNAGVAFPVGPLRAFLNLSRQVHDPFTDIGGGVEYSLGPVSLRIGYMLQNGPWQDLASQNQYGAASYLQGLTAGVGLKVDSLRLDYAVSEGPAELGMNNRISLTLAWGGGADADQDGKRRIK